MGRAGPLRGLPAAGLTPESSGPGPCAQSRVTPAPGPRGREGSGVPTVCGLEAPQGAAERHARRGRFPESHSTTGRARPAPAPRTVADVQRRRGAWAPLEAGCYFSISRLDKGAFHEGCPPRGHVERPRAADTAALPGSGPRGACPEKTGWEGPGKREAEVGGGQAAGLDAPPRTRCCLCGAQTPGVPAAGGAAPHGAQSWHRGLESGPGSSPGRLRSHRSRQRPGRSYSAHLGPRSGQGAGACALQPHLEPSDPRREAGGRAGLGASSEAVGRSRGAASFCPVPTPATRSGPLGLEQSHAPRLPARGEKRQLHVC